MKKAKKVLIMLLCAVLLVGATIFGTIAYLTDTATVKNTFTVGSVGIDLYEVEVDEMGNILRDEDRNTIKVVENEYHLLPGHRYWKNPTIVVDEGSEPCYLFIRVENEIEAIEEKTTAPTVAAQMQLNQWKELVGFDGVYAYAIAADREQNRMTVMESGDETFPFQFFTIDDQVTNETLAAYAGKTIKVTAYAVQADGFENCTPEQIWQAAFASNG